jgi:hypothetical protein
VDQIAVSPDDRADWVGKIYAEAVANGRITPELIAANTNLAAYAGQVASRPTEIKKNGALLIANTQKANTNAPAYLTHLVPPPSPTEAVLLVTYIIGQSDLETLAANRTKAVQIYLSQTGKVEAARLFLIAKGTTLRTDGTRAYLQFR